MKTSRADRFLKSLKNGKIYSYNVLLDEWTIMFGTVIGFLNFIKQHSKYNLIQCVVSNKQTLLTACSCSINLIML